MERALAKSGKTDKRKKERKKYLPVSPSASGGRCRTRRRASFFSPLAKDQSAAAI